MITVIKNVQSCDGMSLARFCHTATSSSRATNSYVANAVCPQMPKSIHANLDILDKRRHGHGREFKLNNFPFSGKSVQGKAIGTDNRTIGALMYMLHKVTGAFLDLSSVVTSHGHVSHSVTSEGSPSSPIC